MKKAAEYISYVRRKNGSHSQDIEELRRQNAILEQQSEFIFTLVAEYNSSIDSPFKKRRTKSSEAECMFHMNPILNDRHWHIKTANPKANPIQSYVFSVFTLFWLFGMSVCAVMPMWFKPGN